MTKQFILTYFRIIARNKVSFFIKSLGLVFSLATTLLIATYLHDEFLYDQFHTDADRIFRITTRSNFSGSENRYTRTSLPVAEHLRGLPSIKSIARVFERSATISLPLTDKKFDESRVWFADSTLAEIFTFQTVSGNVHDALLEPNSIVLSEKAAQKYFDSTNPIGQFLLVENKINLEVKAVVKEFPKQSSLQFDFILPFNRFFDLENPNNVDYLKSDWIYSSVFTYIKTNNVVLPSQLDEEIRSRQSLIPDERVKENITLAAQPITEIHLHSQFTGEQQTTGITYVYIFASIGLLLLIISVINYMSLTSAEWRNRKKELEVRSMMGSSRLLTVKQFMVESLTFLLIVLPLCCITAYIALPYFNNITEKQLTIDQFAAWPVIIVFLIAAACYIVLTGVTEASQRSRSIQKGAIGYWRKLALQPSLVIQCSLALIVAGMSLTIYRQLQFIQNKSLGFEKDNVIIVPLFSDNFNTIIGQVTGELRGRMNFFEQEVLKYGQIEAISCSAFQPGEGGISALTKTDSLTENDNVFIRLNSVDFDFLETYNIPLLAGRYFSKEYGTDHLEAFIINEEAVKELGFGSPEAAIGKNIEAVGKKAKVVGVMKNFHFEGLQQAIRPLMFEVAAWKFSTFSIRINKDQKQEAIALLKSKWSEVFPETVFSYRFLEDELARNYAREASLGKLTKGISFLAVVLSLLGIYASSLHQAQNRLKELTIRQVLGASIVNTTSLFTKPYLFILLMSLVIALPFVAWLRSFWLESFAFQAAWNWVDLIYTLVVALILIAVVLFQQLIKVARLNPVANLRHE